MKTVKAIRLDDNDTCAVLTDSADAGDIVTYHESGAGKSITARETIPIWHKIAVKPMKAGGKVYKYGAVIGIVLKDIAAGEYVHTHNVRSPGKGEKHEVLRLQAPRR